MASGKLFQVLTAIACGFGSLSMGSLFVWPSYSSYLLTAENTTILTAPMTETEESLLGSLPSLGAMVGTGVAGLMIETFGRKLGGAILSLSFALSWALISVSKSSIPILVARFFSGIGGGANLVFGPMFISEVVEDSIRGALASAPILFFNIGALSSYLVGWFLGYQTIVWINLACGVLGCVLLMSVPESPVYLMRKNKEEAAGVSMAIYRGVSPASVVVQKELKRIKAQITPVVEMKAVSVSEKEANENEKFTIQEETEVEQPKSSAIRILFTSPASRRAFTMVLMVLSMQVVMGIGPVQVYAKFVFRQADPSRADLYSVLFAVVVVVGCMVAGAITDKAGRRVLIISSSIMVAVCMATLGMLLQTKMGPGWLTVAMILLFCFSFMCGAGLVPYVLLAEVFTPEVQACASMLIIEWFWLINFVNLAVFPWLNDLLGIHGTFYIFAGNSVINAVLGYMFVPETKGLSNAQIQEILLRPNRR